METVDKYLQKFNKQVKIVNNILNKYDMIGLITNKDLKNKINDEYIAEAIDITSGYIYCLADNQGRTYDKKIAICKLCCLIQDIMVRYFTDYFFRYEINLKPIAKEIYEKLGEFNNFIKN